MAFFRGLFLVLLSGSAGCFAMWIYSRDVRWRRLGVRILQWTVGSALAFFTALILLRLFTDY